MDALVGVLEGGPKKRRNLQEHFALSQLLACSPVASNFCQGFCVFDDLFGFLGLQRSVQAKCASKVIVVWCSVLSLVQTSPKGTLSLHDVWEPIWEQAAEYISHKYDWEEQASQSSGSDMWQ
jgi:hypothetical protein